MEREKFKDLLSIVNIGEQPEPSAWRQILAEFDRLMVIQGGVGAMSRLILSIFPGIDLLGRAFEEEGYCVVRGPDLLWGGDIKNFHPPAGVFEGVIGGPPCQCFSRLVNIVKHRGFAVAENLIPEYERVVGEASPTWFVMENVREAPAPVIAGYAIMAVTLNNRWLGEEQNRVRVFNIGRLGQLLDIRPHLEVALFENPNWSQAVCASGGTDPRAKGQKLGHNTRLKYHGWKSAAALRESLRLQGLPENFLAEAPFTIEGKHKVVGNGVPLPMGRAIAKAVRKAGIFGYQVASIQ